MKWLDKGLNVASELSSEVGKAVSIASSKKEQIGKQLVNGVLLFIILLVFGCLDFATLKFHIEYILTASYWGTVFSKTIAGICAFNIGVNIMWETELLKDAILEEAIKLYNHLNKFKKDDFEYFIEIVFNPKEKTKAYISQINRKIYFFNKLSRAKDRLLYSSVLPEKQEEKLKNRYCCKRQELEDLKDPDFIAKNLDSLKVSYMRVDATLFELEIDGSSVSHGVKTKGNIGASKVKASSNVALGMLGFSMFFTAVGLELDGQQFANQMEAFWHYLLKCLTDVGIVLWQALRGVMKTRKIISNELTQPYVGRNKVLRDYYKWQLDNEKITENDYNSIVNLPEEYTVEMSESELKELKNKGGQENDK